MTTTITDTTRLLLNTHEVSQQLGISRTKVYELMASGRLRSIQIGRSRRVPTFALHEFIEELSSR